MLVYQRVTLITSSQSATIPSTPGETEGKPHNHSPLATVVGMILQVYHHQAHPYPKKPMEIPMRWP